MGIIIESTPHKVVARINWVNALRLALGIKYAIKVCKYSRLEKIKSTSMPTPPPYGRKIMWCFFLGQGWAGFSYWIFLHSKYTVSNITLGHSLLWKEGIGSRGSQNQQVTFPSPTLKASCCFCPGLANPPPFPLFFPIPPSPLQTLGKKWRKAHQPRRLFTSLCFPARPEQTAINSALSHPPSSLLLSCPLCFVSFSVCVFRLRKKQFPPSSRRRQATSVASSKHNLIVTGPHGPWHLERPRTRGSRSDSLRNSSAWPLLSWTRLGCNESHRKPEIPLAKNPLKLAPSPGKERAFQVWGNRASWTWRQRGWRRNTPFPFSKQPSRILFFSNRVTPNWQDFQSYKFPCPQPSLKKNFLVRLAGLGCASKEHFTNS